MTSKRMGILVIALFALWSLAGSGSFVTQPNTPGDLNFGASWAYAGDPDDYTAPNDAPVEEQTPEGDPDDYTDPVPEDEPSPTDEEEDEVKTLFEIALSVLLGIGGVVH